MLEEETGLEFSCFLQRKVRGPHYIFFNLLWLHFKICALYLEFVFNLKGAVNLIHFPATKHLSTQHTE